MFYGEILSILTAMTWTVTALCADVASRRMGQLQMNVLRMGASLIILGLILWVTTGSPLPQHMNGEALAWLLASGAVGYVFGDYCLFTTYVLVGSRIGQLFMTLAPLFSALTAWLLLGETLSLQAIAGIVVTITGIGVVIRGKDPSKSPRQGRLSYPLVNSTEASSILSDTAPAASTFSEISSTSFTSSLKYRLPPADTAPAAPLPDGRGWGWVWRGWKWVFFGIGAGMGQGVGIVLSKVGMGLCEETPLLPMAATMVRAVAGFAGFGIAYYLRGDRARMRAGLRDRTTMKAATGTIIMGPVIGVSLSLLAVQLAPAGIASTLMALTPVFILWPSRWLFKQPITARELIGSVIAVAGVALFFL